MDKNFALEQLEVTQQKLMSEVAGLSNEQLAFKPMAEIWSINEILEHIALAENGIWQAVRQGLAVAEDPLRRDEIKVSDEDLYRRTASRKYKAVSPEVIKPIGKFANAEAALAFFNKRRNATIEYIKSTTDDLRNRYWKHFSAGTIDLYQTIIFMAGHSERHTAQIIELKQHENFPTE